MIRKLAPVALLALAVQAVAQTGEPDDGPPVDVPNVIVSPLTGELIELFPEPAEPRQRVEAGTGAVIRWLDKVSGEVRDVSLSNGASQRLGRIDVAVAECRYPPENPSGEAFAWLEVRSLGRDEPDFRGWMVASSPALSALDHPRYDVWVIRCTTA